MRFNYKKSVKNIANLNILILILFTLANFGSKELSVDPDKPHKINFYGTIKTLQEPEYNVKNISISGQYTNISIYPKPQDSSIDPESNITKLNLEDINAIYRLKNYTESVYTYNSRKYIEIEIEWKEPNIIKQTYLIENYKKIFCYKDTTNCPKKEISFQALEKLTINSFVFSKQDQQC